MAAELACILKDTSSIKEIKDYLKRHVDSSVAIEVASETSYFETYGNLTVNLDGELCTVFFSDFDKKQLKNHPGVEINNERFISLIGQKNNTVDNLFEILLERFGGYTRHAQDGAYYYEVFTNFMKEAER